MKVLCQFLMPDSPLKHCSGQSQMINTKQYWYFALQLFQLMVHLSYEPKSIQIVLSVAIMHIHILQMLASS